MTEAARTSPSCLTPRVGGFIASGRSFKIAASGGSEYVKHGLLGAVNLPHYVLYMPLITLMMPAAAVVVGCYNMRTSPVDITTS